MRQERIKRSHRGADRHRLGGARVMRNRARVTGRRERGTFFALPHAVLACANYRALPGSAVKLLCDLGGQYNGRNNGNLSPAWKLMRRQGWRSKQTLQRALDALREHGLIEQTRQGGLHRCSLYSLTWLAIDDCSVRMDVSPTRVPSGAWKQPPESANKKTPSTEIVPSKDENRTYGKAAA